MQTPRLDTKPTIICFCLSLKCYITQSSAHQLYRLLIEVSVLNALLSLPRAPPLLYHMTPHCNLIGSSYMGPGDKWM